MANRELIDTATNKRYVRRSHDRRRIEDEVDLVEGSETDLHERAMAALADKGVGGDSVPDAVEAVAIAAADVQAAESVAASNKHEGFTSEAEYRRHLFAVASDAPAEEVVGLQGDAQRAASPDSLAFEAEPVADRLDMLRLREDLSRLKDDVESIRARVDIIKIQAQTVVSSNIKWADASAHAQLGPYPWAKLAGAVVATVIATKLMRKLPLGAIGTVFAPLVLGQINNGPRRRR